VKDGGPAPALAVEAASEGSPDPATFTVGSVSRNALGVFVATALALAVGFLTSLLIARVLGPADQGAFAALRTDSAVLMSLLGLGAPAALYYFSSGPSGVRPALVGASLVHAALLAVAALGLASLLGAGLGEAQIGDDRTDLYLLAALLVPATFLEYSYVGMLRAELRLRLANLLVLAGKVAGLVGAIVLVAILDLGVEGALAAILAVSAVQVLPALPVLVRKGVALSVETGREVLSYGLRAQLGVVFRFASLRFDLLLLSFFAEPKVVGYYAVAQILAELVLLVPQAFGWVLSPIVTRGDQPGLTRRLLRFNGTLTLLAVGAMAVAGPIFVLFAYGDAYEPAIVPLLVLLPGVWLLACGELVSWVLSARGRPGTASWLVAYQGLATVALDLALIPPFELVGAAVASLLAYASFGILSLVLIARHDDVPVVRLVISRREEIRNYVAELRRRVSGLWPR
jgi:O-antigen/teichoic acid export membrane protein